MAEATILCVALLAGSAAVGQLPLAVLADKALELAGTLAEPLLATLCGSSVDEDTIDSQRRWAHILALDRVEFAERWWSVLGADVLALHRIEHADRDSRRRGGHKGSREASKGDKCGECSHAER